MKIIYQCGIAMLLLMGLGCGSKNDSTELSESQKLQIRELIQNELNEGIEATRTKDINLYISQMPTDLIIYDENGEVISREKQKEYTLRDWAIIDTTLQIMMRIDSIKFIKKDSVIVYTYQEWERVMFQRNGIATDTILTNQRHMETWKKTPNGWFGYEIQELGGNVFINGKEYNPE